MMPEFIENACPPLELLEQLLEQQLEPTVRDRLAEHLETCNDCQLRLDDLTADPELQTWAEDEQAVAIPALDSLISRMREDQSLQDTPVAGDSAANSAVVKKSVESGEFDPRAPLTLSDFELGRQLGSGGMGAVYQARQKSLNKQVAVKVLGEQFSQQTSLVKRFLQEAAAAAGLRHPNIVDVHGIGRTPERGYFLVMDLVEGKDLQVVCRSGELESERIPTLVADIAEAIDHAHQHGVIHRDLKPSNILIDANDRALVTDFGVAKLLGQNRPQVELSRAGHPIGTPSYMAPEQADRRWGEVDARTDVYGLGGVLYYLLCGRHPFSGEVDDEIQMIARVISTETPKLPSELNSSCLSESLRAGTSNSEVPAELEAICMKCLQKQPSDRYASAGELAMALREFVASSSKPVTDERADQPSVNVVILYKRHVEPDEHVLGFLESQLSERGHGVFVDRHLPIGVPWAQEIEQRIRNADVVIALLSAASVQSEMLAHEVQIAHEAATAQGKPCLLPVRVNFEDRLPAELAGVLDRLQYFAWATTDDDAALLEALANSFGDRHDSISEPNAESSEQTSQQQRPWNLEPPLGAVSINSDFYLVRDADQDFQSAVARRDSIVLVRGARQMGKTSLLARALGKAREAGAKVVLTDFQKLNAIDLESAENLFLALGEWIADKLDLDVLPEDVWNARRGASVNFERYLRREVLKKIDGPLVWGLDEVDRLFTCPFSSEVFGLFRSWHNERALDPSGPWMNLTLAIAYATEAHLFITDMNQSPFNVGTRVTLADFSVPQIADLNARYREPLRSYMELEAFHQLLGGHPYLTNRSLYEMTTRGLDMQTFSQQIDQEDGVFGDHLRRILVLLAQDEPLSDVVRSVLRGEGCTSDESFYRLRSAGVMSGDSPRDMRPRCELYATYLERHLGSA